MNKQRNMLLAGSVFWFAFVYWFAARGGFVSGPSQPPLALPIELTVQMPFYEANAAQAYIFVPPKIGSGFGSMKLLVVPGRFRTAKLENR